MSDIIDSLSKVYNDTQEKITYYFLVLITNEIIKNQYKEFLNND